MSDIWSRRNVIATVVMGLVTAALSVLLFIYDRDQEGIGEDVVPPVDEPTSATIEIASVYVSEVPLSVPSFFEISIQPRLSSAFGIDLIVDFGHAEVQECGYSPARYVENAETTDKNFRKFRIAQLVKGEKFYLRCQLGTPYFSQVIVQGGNISISKSLTFQQYKDSLNEAPTGFWAILGYSLVVFFTLMFCFKIVGLLFD